MVGLFILVALATCASGREAYTVAISERQITLEVRVRAGNWITLTEVEGELMRITEEETGTTIGLTPLVEHDGRITVTVFEIKRPVADREALKFLERFTLTGAGTFSLERSPIPIDVRLPK